MMLRRDIISDTLRRLCHAALHLLWPVNCPVCGKLGSVLCAECVPSLFGSVLSRCLICGGTFPCLRHQDAPRIRLASVYDGKTKEVIHAMKYGGCRAIGRRLGICMARLWKRPDADLLLLVPLHIGSKRGYNQSLEIALGLGDVWNIEAADIARWTRVVTPRARLGMSERVELRKDAFGVGPEVKGLRIAIVDDVCTTGATLSRLAAACKDAGAEVIGAYAVASPTYYHCHL